MTAKELTVNAKPQTPLLTVLQARHGAELGDRLLQLRTPAREDIANAAYAEGFLTALNMLGASLPALEKVMHEAGYDQCGGCEEWFPRLELEESKETSFEVVGEEYEDTSGNSLRCEECALAEDADWSAPPPPAPTTPEEIAAAEEKRNKAREAVIRQEERAAKRREILAGVPEPAPGTKPD